MFSHHLPYVISSKRQHDRHYTVNHHGPSEQVPSTEPVCQLPPRDLQRHVAPEERGYHCILGLFVPVECWVLKYCKNRSINLVSEETPCGRDINFRSIIFVKSMDCVDPAELFSKHTALRAVQLQ